MNQHYDHKVLRTHQGRLAAGHCLGAGEGIGPRRDEGNAQYDSLHHGCYYFAVDANSEN